MRARASGEPRSNQAEREAFESALRRDLAGAPPFAYESHVGGPGKRAFDLAVVSFFAPAWLALLAYALILAVVRNGLRAVSVRTRIGYGGRAFALVSFNLRPRAPQTAEMQTDAAATPLSERSEVKWRQVLERLPQLWAVLMGKMSLVGPAPLSREQVGLLKGARRHYLSARPGVIGLGAVSGGEANGGCKSYAQRWSLTNDLLIMWDALNGLRNRGRLWAPTRERQP